METADIRPGLPGRLQDIGAEKAAGVDDTLTRPPAKLVDSLSHRLVPGGDDNQVDSINHCLVGSKNPATLNTVSHTPRQFRIKVSNGNDGITAFRQLNGKSGGDGPGADKTDFNLHIYLLKLK